MDKLNIFYQEPQPDRWFKYDRYPRKVLRRIIRGKQRPGGVEMIALQLMQGLDKLNIPYRYNDFNYAKNHIEEVVCLIGKPHLLFQKNWKNPIIFGAGVYSHPLDCPNLFSAYPTVKKILVPGEWTKQMFDQYYGINVIAWPVGTDTEKWNPLIKLPKQNFDFLIYDKVSWFNRQHESGMLNSIKKFLSDKELTYTIISYGSYSHDELIEKIAVSRSAVFLSANETQGLAYQQILATGTSIFAWNPAGFWKDPFYYPHKVKFQPVSSVPYWDSSCGMTFRDVPDFKANLSDFLKKQENKFFSPRKYILENLTLEVCAQKYLEIYDQVVRDLKLEAD